MRAGVRFRAKEKALILRSVRLALLMAIAGSLTLLLAGRVTAQPSPQPFTVTTTGLQVVYPASKPAPKAAGALDVTTSGLSVVYSSSKQPPPKTAQPFTITTDGLKVVYPKGK